MSDPDGKLARRARSGDRQALAALYDRHRRGLFGFLVRGLGDHQLAEDVFQEVWIKVMRRIDSYEPGVAGFRAWLFRVAANASVDRVRRESRHQGLELDAGEGAAGERRIDRLPSTDPGPERVGAGRLFARDLADALRGLSEAQRSAILLRHQQGLSYAELSAVLGVPEGTAKTVVHRGVLALREQLKEWKNE